MKSDLINFWPRCLPWTSFTIRDYLGRSRNLISSQLVSGATRKICHLWKFRPFFFFWKKGNKKFDTRTFYLFLLCLIEPRSTPAGRQLLVGYWGQNGAGPANGRPNWEKPLSEVCQTTKYDILAVSFVMVFFDPRNKGISNIWSLLNNWTFITIVTKG